MTVHISNVDMRSMCIVRGLTPSVCSWAKLVKSILRGLDECVYVSNGSQEFEHRLEAQRLTRVVSSGTNADYQFRDSSGKHDTSQGPSAALPAIVGRLGLFIVPGPASETRITAVTLQKAVYQWFVHKRGFPRLSLSDMRVGASKPESQRGSVVVFECPLAAVNRGWAP